MEKEEVGVSFGGWYQRTTLHLTEVYELFSKGTSALDLSKEKLKTFQDNLDIKQVSREIGPLEYVKVITNSGIELRYYEDGLYTFEFHSNDVSKTIKLLEDYYENKFSPAINYIFSLGAPTPKILSDAKELHPVVISIKTRNPNAIKIDEKKFGKIYSKMEKDSIAVYKTPGYIFIMTPPEKSNIIKEIAEMQIFFREFKDQLQKYLRAHRKLWEYLDVINKKEKIKGKEIEELRAKLENYKRTIDLIKSRINQMGAYIQIRQSIAVSLKINKYLVELFRYRFEDLKNTLEYVKEIWRMTIDYVDSTISVLAEIEDRVIGTKLDSIQIIIGIGIISVLFEFLSAEAFPTTSLIGITTLVFVGILAFLLDSMIKAWAKNKRYDVEIPDLERDI